MKKTLMILLVLCLAVMPVFALADSTLRVQGNASVSITPDTAVLRVGYAGENSDSSVAQQETADAVIAIVEAIKAHGVAEDDIATANLNTYPVYNYTDEGQTLRGYRVEHMLSVTVKDLDKTGDVLDAALKAGANQADSITYQSSREKEVYLQALALAVENASAKADALAIATGVWLGSLEQVNEISTSYGVARFAEAAKYDDAASGDSIGSTLMTGDLEVSASVELVYEVR